MQTTRTLLRWRQGAAAFGLALCAMLPACGGTAADGTARDPAQGADRTAASHAPVLAARRADSLAERRADSVVRWAARWPGSVDSARVLLTPPAYARDPAFKASLLAEERALASGACEHLRAAREDSDADIVGEQLQRGQPLDLTVRPLEGTPLWACVEREVRRAHPLQTAADSARDSTRLAVRERYRRAVYAHILVSVAQDPDPADLKESGVRVKSAGVQRFGPNGPAAGRFDPAPNAGPQLPIRYDVGRAAYHFPRQPRIDPEPRDTMP